MKEYDNLRNKLHENNKNFLIFHLFMGHGTWTNGMRSLYFNQLDKKANFYKSFPGEK